MPNYRAYILGGKGHRFRLANEFAKDHVDDAAALREAKKLIDGHDVEIWEAGRLVARLDHTNGNPIDYFSWPTEGQKLVDRGIVQQAEIAVHPDADVELDWEGG